MTTGIQDELHAFAARLLERRGGLVDWPSAVGEGTAVLTPELAAALRTDDEMIRLSCSSGGDGLCVNLATDFLDEAGRLLEAEPRIGAFRIRELYLKSGKVDETVARAFTWHNAKVTITEKRSTRVEYHTWWFRASIVSEDRWETRLPVTVNSLSGVEVDMPDPLGLWELEPQRKGGKEAATTCDRALARARLRVKDLAADFLKRMDSRLERDRKRIREYYGALLRETRNKKSRGAARVNPEKLEEKTRAVDLELRRKLAELNERYAMELSLVPVVLVRTDIPVLAVDLSVLRKRAKRKHTVFWHPVIKRLEPLCCSRCGDGVFSVSFTNEEAQPVCAACAD